MIDLERSERRVEGELDVGGPRSVLQQQQHCGGGDSRKDDSGGGEEGSMWWWWGVMLVLVGGERESGAVRWASEQVRSEDVEEEVEGRYRYDTSGNHNSRSCDNAVVRLIACSCSNERPTSAARFTFVTRGAGGTRGERSIVYLTLHRPPFSL